MKRIPVSGRYGMLVVAGEPVLQGKYLKYPMRCDCGGETWTTSTSLVRGMTRSCGCVHITHGETRNGKSSPEYLSWKSMKQRCNDPKATGYQNYGGRGIRICERWAQYENFLADMGRRPTPDHSLDRIDNDRDYEPGNCRWATPLEQTENRRVSCRLTIRGETLLVTQWAKRGAVCCGTLKGRLRAGWDPERAVFLPPTRRQTKFKKSASAPQPPHSGA